MKPARDETNIKIRLTPEDKSTITNKAAQCHLTVTDYILRTALQRPINTSNTAGLIVELSNLAHQQKQCYAMDTRNEKKYQEILDAIVTAIQTIPYRISTGKRSTNPWKR